jgi:hypothetical protein
MADDAPDYSQQAVLNAVRNFAQTVADQAAEAGIAVTPDRVLSELTANLLTSVFICPDAALIEAVVSKAQAQALDIIERARVEADMDAAAKITGWGQA